MTERETRIDDMNESKTRFISGENPFLQVDSDTTVPVAQCNGLCHVTQTLSRHSYGRKSPHCTLYTTHVGECSPQRRKKTDINVEDEKRQLSFTTVLRSSCSEWDGWYPAQYVFLFILFLRTSWRRVVSCSNHLCNSPTTWWTCTISSAHMHDDPPFIVLTETKFSFRCIPVWDRYSPHRTRVEKKKHMW